MTLCVSAPTEISHLFEVMFLEAQLSASVSHASIKALPPLSISLQINIWLPLAKVAIFVLAPRGS